MTFIEKLEKELEKKAEQMAPSTALGKAVRYTKEVLSKAAHYLDLACLPPDNNAAEREIRPFVVGRKNWCTPILPAELMHRLPFHLYWTY